TYGIGATEPGTPQNQGVPPQLIAPIARGGWVYWIRMISILIVLSLSSNTWFANFPRLCRSFAVDGCLPHSFTNGGRRLVYVGGVWVLAFLSAILLSVFHGVTDRLIPLFAVGAFLAFTLSQSGMVAHRIRQRGRGWYASMAVNALGATATAITV